MEVLRPEKQQQYELNTVIKEELYKTELCTFYCSYTNHLIIGKNYSRLGWCYYGRRCKFAHTESELVKLEHDEKYKSKMCKNYSRGLFCSYGIRCHFAHGYTELLQYQNTTTTTDTTTTNLNKSSTK